MDIAQATLVAGFAGAIGGVIGSLAGVLVGHILTSRREDRERVRSFELAALDRAEAEIKALTKRITSSAVLPRPVASTADLDQVLDLVFADPSVIPADDAVNELLEIAKHAIFGQSLKRFAQRFVLVDISDSNRTTQRLEPVLSEIAVAIRDRRRELLGAPDPRARHRLGLWGRLRHQREA